MLGGGADAAATVGGGLGSTRLGGGAVVREGGRGCTCGLAGSGFVAEGALGGDAADKGSDSWAEGTAPVSGPLATGGGIVGLDVAVELLGAPGAELEFVGLASPDVGGPDEGTEAGAGDRDEELAPLLVEIAGECAGEGGATPVGLLAEAMFGPADVAGAADGAILAHIAAMPVGHSKYVAIEPTNRMMSATPPIMSVRDLGRADAESGACCGLTRMGDTASEGLRMFVARLAGDRAGAGPLSLRGGSATAPVSAVSGMPSFLQNFALGRLLVPHTGQIRPGAFASLAAEAGALGGSRDPPKVCLELLGSRTVTPS